MNERNCLFKGRETFHAEGRRVKEQSELHGEHDQLRRYRRRKEKIRKKGNGQWVRKFHITFLRSLSFILLTS